MSMELLIVLIPALPLAGFLFAVLVGPRLDRVPVHGHAEHEAESHVAESHGDPHAADHDAVDESGFRLIPSEEEQAATSPHTGHADDLANSNGADGVIPPDLNDGLGQAGHVTEDGPQPVYRSWIVPVGLVALSWLFSMIVFAGVVFGGSEYHVTLYEWIGSGDFRIDIAFTVDSLTAMLLLVVSTVGLLVHVYSIGYMNGDRGFWRFFAYLNLFVFSMLLLILGDNFLLLYVGWEAVGLCSYALIGFWYKKPSAAGAAKKAFVVNRIGDLGFGLGVILIWVNLGTLNFREVFEQVGTLDGGTITLIALLLFAGAVGKSAQFPLHVWLPDAMEGPTPVSALIHAATMVNAGVYLVARANPIFAESPTAMWVVASIGVFTAIFAAAIALTQNDIKKVLAYSTVSQLAYMFFALGIGAWVAAIFHLVSHGFFKGLLFMGSGSVIHGAGGEQDIRFLGGMRERMVWTYRTMVVGALALAGIPIFAGFFSKDEILAEAFNRGYYVFYIVGVVVALMTAFYTFRMIFMTFWGTWRGPKAAWDHIHESAPTMVAPLVILAVPTVVAGLILGIPPEGGIIHGWLEEVFHGAEEAHAGVLPGSIAAGEHHGFE
ncbi:MAG TPA: NADH-quinone oxidoreductase subunit L, partial [Candidatus Binatia bacterium]|nr:NADH-quinone oxidoreductase subunit L [Candidatus Binatia bacterium]